MVKMLRPIIKRPVTETEPTVNDTIEELKKKIDELEDKLNEGNGDDTNGPE